MPFWNVPAVAGFGALLAVLLPGPAQAQQGSRYTMERAENGYVRLDTRTGEMSICRERGDQLVCQMAADERRAFQEELDALSDRVSALEDAVGLSDGSDLPSEEEFNRTMGMMERFIRRFFSIVEDLNRDFSEPDPPAEDAPERT